MLNDLLMLPENNVRSVGVSRGAVQVHLHWPSVQLNEITQSWSRRRTIMAEYVCDQCGMGVTGMKCAKCGEELVHDHITTDDGKSVAVTKCPDGCGMIKSPMCCGTDMSCSV